MLLRLITDNLRKMLVGVVILCFMLSYLNINSFAKPYQIKDVPQTDTAYKSIQDVLNQGWMSLTLSKFYPDKNITRGEFAYIMTKFNGQLSAAAKITKTSFKDVNLKDANAKYIELEKPYITYYKQKDGNYYKPSNYITREDALVAIVKALGYDTDTAITEGSDSEVSLDDVIDDANKVSASLKSFVTTGVVNELIDLKDVNGGTYLYPKNNITRRQFAELLINAKNAKEMNKVDESTDDSTTDGSDTNDNNTNTPKNIPTDKNLQSTNTTPTPKSTTASTKKYTVETIASVKSPTSMVTNKNGDIYYVNNNQIKKLSNGKLTSVADGNIDFAFKKPIKEVGQELIDNSMAPENSIFHQSSHDTDYINLDTFNIASLIYDSTLDKIYILGTYSSSNYNNTLDNYYKDSFGDENRGKSFKIQITALFDISDISKPIVSYLFNTYEYEYVAKGDLACLDKGGVIFSVFGTALYRFNINTNTIAKYTDYPNDYGNTRDSEDYETSSVLDSGYNLLFGTGNSLTLSTYNLSSATFSNNVLSLKDVPDPITALTSYQNKFYFSAGKKIYSVNQNGVVTNYIDNNSLTIKDGIPIDTISKFILDSHGNIIFYDTTNKSIRRINV